MNARILGIIYLCLGIGLSMYYSYWLVEIGASIISFIGGLFFLEEELLKSSERGSGK